MTQPSGSTLKRALALRANQTKAKPLRKAVYSLVIAVVLAVLCAQSLRASRSSFEYPCPTLPIASSNGYQPGLRLCATARACA